MKAFVAAALLAAAAPVSAGKLPARPPTMGGNRLVVATSPQLAPLMHNVAVELERRRPGLRVSILPVGSDVAMAELYVRHADIAVIGRAAFDPEVKAFQWIYQHPPQEWPVLEGSISAPGHSPRVQVVVNSANPLSAISVGQLNAVFRAGAPIRWHDLGVKGRLGNLPIHPMMPDAEQGTGRFIRGALFADATLFAWSRVSETGVPIDPTGGDDKVGQRLAAAIAADPQGLALVPGRATDGTRAIPLRCDGSGAAVTCTSSGALARTVYAYADPSLGSNGRSFLRILVGGAEDGLIDPAPYLPLPKDQGRELLEKLR